MALVPWWRGVLGALRGMPQVFTAVASIAPEDRGLMLLQGAAELQCLRLLGAWASASLLLATAAGLLIASLRRHEAGEDAALSEAAERRLEAVLMALLAAVAWLAAFEALEVTRTFVAVVGADAADRDVLLAYGADQLKLLGLLRMGAVGGAVLAFLALGRRWMERQPRADRGVALAGTLRVSGGRHAGCGWTAAGAHARRHRAGQRPLARLPAGDAFRCPLFPVAAAHSSTHLSGARDEVELARVGVKTHPHARAACEA